MREAKRKVSRMPGGSVPKIPVRPQAKREAPEKREIWKSFEKQCLLHHGGLDMMDGSSKRGMEEGKTHFVKSGAE